MDPDGRRIKLGSWLARALFAVTGYKTPGLRYVEKAAQRLKQSETGAKLYEELDAIEEVIVVDTGTLPKIRRGSETELKTGRTVPHGKYKFEGATIMLDPDNIEESIKAPGGDRPKDAAAITLGHEFGHTKAAKDDLMKYEIERYSRTDDQNQADPIERKVRKELRKLNDDE